MAKLYFRYGAMGASKTANALMVAYNYEEKGLTPLVLKPAIENRDGELKIKSRIGLERVCGLVENFITDKPEDKDAYTETLQKLDKYDVIIVDECQFMKPEEVKTLWKVMTDKQIPVICYGLSTDFQQNLFPASAELMKYANVVEEIKTICWCGDGAKCNARLDEKGNVVRTGDQVQMGGTETGLPSYTSLCTDHFLKGDIGPRLRKEFSDFWAEKGTTVEKEDAITVEEITEIKLATIDAKLEEYKMSFINTLKDAYIDFYENLQIRNIAIYPSGQKAFNNFDKRYGLDVFKEELFAIKTSKDWEESEVVKGFHEITYDFCGLDDGTLAGDYTDFDLDTEIGYWLYYYGDIDTAIKSIKESLSSPNGLETLTLNALKTLTKIKDELTGISKLSTVMERLDIIQKYNEESLEHIKVTGENTYTIKWQPQYGMPFYMYAKLSDDGTFLYGKDEYNLENSDWYTLAEDIDKEWTKATTELVKYGKVLPELTKDEQDELVKIFTGKGINNYVAIMSLEEGDEWVLNTVGFSEIPKSIVDKLDLDNNYDGKETLSAYFAEYDSSFSEHTDLLDYLTDEESECGFHIYWDCARHPDEVTLGLYTNGGGDDNLKFSLKDILSKENYETLYNFGYDMIKENKEKESDDLEM